MAYTLQNMITEVRNRGDFNNTQFVTDEELTSYINYSLKELHGHLINNWGGDYFLDSVDVQVPAGATESSGSLPADLLKVAGIDLAVSGKWITIQPFNFNERNLWQSLNLQGQATQLFTNYRYRIRNRKVVLTPSATGAVTLKVWYYPDAPQLNVLTDEISVNDALSGWLEYVIVDVVIKCKIKEETDFAPFMKQKADMLERIKTESQNRDAGSPQTAVDVYATGVRTNPTGYSGWGDGGWGWRWGW